MDRIQRLALGSIVVGIAVLALKYVAYVLTGSIALWSDAVESVVNVATGIVALLASCARHVARARLVGLYSRAAQWPMVPAGQNRRRAENSRSSDVPSARFN